ncbi:metalloprotease [Streptomyces sp. NA04227]|nr:metalloprotease [Streptomyces sp. NA04227]
MRGRRRSPGVWLATAAVLAAGASAVPFVMADAQATGARNCLNGTLSYEHHDAEAGPEKPVVALPARRANWELWGATSPDGKPEKLATGLTDAKDGTFAACHDGSLHQASVRFRSSSAELWRVVKNWDDESEYTFDSERVEEVSGEQDLGTVQVPEEMARAFSVVDTLNILYDKRGTDSPCFTRHQGEGECETLTVAWGRDNEEGGYWDHPSNSDDESHGTDFVLLNADMPDSRHLVLHEAGHWFQWQLHGKWWPEVTGCNPHYFERESSPTCAWTEGFADAVAAHTLGDYRWVYENGDSFDFTNDETTEGWDKGDSVQARVSTSLLDLWAEDGPDGGDWDATLQLMTEQRSSTFEEYFTEGRPTVPLPVDGDAKKIINKHTIDY